MKRLMFEQQHLSLETRLATLQQGNECNFPGFFDSPGTGRIFKDSCCLFQHAKS